MKISLEGLWSTPSTLHLRLVITPKSGSWVRFYNLPVAIDDVPSEVLRTLSAAHTSRECVPAPVDGPEQGRLFDA